MDGKRARGRDEAGCGPGYRITAGLRMWGGPFFLSFFLKYKYKKKKKKKGRPVDFWLLPCSPVTLYICLTREMVKRRWLIAPRDTATTVPFPYIRC
jgi:hypothetical protein